MSGRRIRLDLSDFVLDIGSHRWMFLSDGKFSTVSDLVDQLKEEYTQLEEEDMVQVFMDGDFVIPPWESIEILQSGDLVRVVRTVGKDRKDQVKVTSKSKKPNMKSKETKQEVNRSKANKERKLATVQVQTSSSSSESDTNEDITSKVAAKPIKVLTGQTGKVKVPNNSKQKKDDSTTSSDTSESSSDEDEITRKKPKTLNSDKAAPIINKLVAPAVTKAVSSSDSDSSSDDETDSKEDSKPQLTIAGGAGTKQTQAPNMPGKPKRKRKRKNKNKNKLAPEQIPIFGPQIVPTEAVIKQMSKDQTEGNNHVRFDDKQEEESENMDVVDEEFTAEEIKQLYNQSVSSATTTMSQEQSRNGTNNGENTSSNNAQNITENRNGNTGSQQITNGKPPKSSISKGDSRNSVRTIDTNISCEDVLMKQFDDKRVTNNTIVTKPAPKIVFTPRALSLKEMRKDSPKNKNLKFSTQNQDPDLSQFSALLNCRDAVFNKNEKKADEASMDIVENKDYSAYHAVSDSGPRVGDVIAFKIVEMGENYAPEVSDFKEGKVLECDGTNTVTFELLKMSKKKKTGKFEIGEDADQEEKVQTFNWAELIEPRLMFP